MIATLFVLLAQPYDAETRETLEEITAAAEQGLQDYCDAARTQAEMNSCAAAEFAAADAELNAQWERTATAMKALDAEVEGESDTQPGHFDTLLEGQRAWLRFRDQQCLSESFKARGGSLQPLLAAQCKTYMTELRTEQLRDLAARPE